MEALRALRKRLLLERREGPPNGSAGPCHEPSAAPPAPATTHTPARLDDVAPPEVAERLGALRLSHPALHASFVGLDAAQLCAVLAEEPSVLVRAPVGSGKTRVLVDRVLWLHHVRGVPLSEMAVLTFTNRAADEIRVRLLEPHGARRDHPERSEGPHGELWLTGTFHGVARSLLGAMPIERVGYEPGFTVMDDDACEVLLDRLIVEHRLRIRQRRHLRRRLRALESDAVKDDLRRIAALYAAGKRAMNAMDFDDLIERATELLRLHAQEGPGGRPPLKAIVVDEMQDCEPRELLFLRELARGGSAFFAVGDPHQAIYSWRGSAPEIFSQAQGEFGCRLRSLHVNYRSTRTIVDGARAVLGLQPEASAELCTAREPGERIVLRRHHDPLSEAVYLADRVAELHAEGVPYREIAVLFRLHAQAEPLREAFTARGIACEGSEEPAADAVRLLTLHAAKGLEFRWVFLSGVNDGVVPLGRRRTAIEDAEERRLLYVGLTRARDGVEIGYHARPHAPGAVADPSPYLTWLPSSLMAWHDGPAAPREALPDPPRPRAAPSAPMEVEPASGFRPGQTVRHPRYGTGAVLRVLGGVIECDFGKRGARSFPLELCPLTLA